MTTATLNLIGTIARVILALVLAGAWLNLAAGFGLAMLDSSNVLATLTAGLLTAGLLYGVTRLAIAAIDRIFPRD
jgi:Na+/phosphate symporter